MRWQSRALLVATYGEPLCRVRFIRVGAGYPHPDIHRAPPDGVDPEEYTRALAVAQEIAHHNFFITHFMDHPKRESVNNLLCGSIAGDVEAQALGDPREGSWELTIPVERSMKFLLGFDTSKLVEGEPIAHVAIATHFSFLEVPVTFLGPPVQR